MPKPIEIGQNLFQFKKDAIGYYRAILNSYDFGQELNFGDFNDVYDLLRIHPKAKDKVGLGVFAFRIGRVQYNTKCFEILRHDESTEFFSYINCINGKQSPILKFSKACKRAIKDDLRQVKLDYFERHSQKGKVKCQETSELFLWEDLHIDHRQPNTFSVIIDRFVEVKNIDVCNVEYVKTADFAVELADVELKEAFREYHKSKANLRIVSKQLNQRRSHQGRIQTQKKDLKIK